MMMTTGSDDDDDDVLHAATTTTTTISSADNSCVTQNIIPLIHLPDLDASDDLILLKAANQVTEALKTSGFLLIKSDNYLPLELQQKAIQCTTNILLSSNNQVIAHPTDPKKYIMIESLDDIQTKCCCNDDDTTASSLETMTAYWNALEQVKKQVLMCLATGLQLPADYFINLHKQNKSALRLLHYPKMTTAATTITNDSEESQTPPPQGAPIQKNQLQQPIIRCKPHSDYGSITLLLTDGIPGLQALINDKWIDVPYVEGALVVNIGSLLSEWTNGVFLATLHRVVGSSNENNNMPRTSLAFFADPDQDISSTLKKTGEHNRECSSKPSNKSNMSVAEYIQWRSGGTGTDRSGLDFTEGERDRVEKAK